MTYSAKRFGVSAASSLFVLVVVLYLIASAAIVVGSLSVVGIGGMFMTAGDLEANNVKAFPVMGDIEEAPTVTDTTACEERPMIAFQADSLEAQDFSLHKDVEIPFFEDWWMTISIDEPQGALEGDQLTFYTTQMEMGTMSVTNVELTEGGDPGRGDDYIEPDDRETWQRSDDIWGPDSGEFLLIGDPVDRTGDAPETTATDVKAWLHAATGENVEFIADVDDPEDFIDINIDYVNSTEMQDRYDSIGIDTRNPDAYEREGYFDCLPGND